MTDNLPSTPAEALRMIAWMLFERANAAADSAERASCSTLLASRAFRADGLALAAEAALKEAMRLESGPSPAELIAQGARQERERIVAKLKAHVAELRRQAAAARDDGDRGKAHVLYDEADATRDVAENIEAGRV